jgi:hypothetical protein
MCKPLSAEFKEWGLQKRVNRSVVQHTLSQFDIECCFDYGPIVTFSRELRIFQFGGGGGGKGGV